MSWRVEYRCVACKKAMTWDEMMDSLGCCQRCGHTSGHTVCDCTKHPYALAKKRTGRPWWQFWKPAFVAVRIYKQQ